MSDTTGTNQLKINLKLADAAMSLKTWWGLIFIYPLARRFTVFIVNRTRISANQITFCAIVLRMVTAAYFLSGSRHGLIIGAIAYYLAYVCDCSDGTVARIRNQSSELGRYLDHVSDLVGDVLILGALAWSQGLLLSPFVLAMAFMHIAECYMSYLAGFAIGSFSDGKLDKVFAPFNRYRSWWFSRNIKSSISFPDYCALVFVFCPLLNIPAVGLQYGFFVLLAICLYTVLSTFVTLHTTETRFP